VDNICHRLPKICCPPAYEQIVDTVSACNPCKRADGEGGPVNEMVPHRDRTSPRLRRFRAPPIFQKKKKKKIKKFLKIINFRYLYKMDPLKLIFTFKILYF
jgi:hypothetical protein